MLVTAHSNTHNTGHNTITVASFAGWIFMDAVSGARSAAMLNLKTLSVHYTLLKTPAHDFKTGYLSGPRCKGDNLYGGGVSVTVMNNDVLY